MLQLSGKDIVVDPDPHGFASFWQPGSASGSASAASKNPDPHEIPIHICPFYTSEFRFNKNHKNEKNQDPHQSDKLDPDPHQFADDKAKMFEI